MSEALNWVPGLRTAGLRLTSGTCRGAARAGGVKLSERLTLAVDPDTKAEVAALAARLGVCPADVARAFIQRGLQQVAPLEVKP